MAAVMDHGIWPIFFGKLDKKYVDAIARSTNDIIILLNASLLSSNIIHKHQESMDDISQWAWSCHLVDHF